MARGKSPEQVKRIVEALLFATDEPVPVRKLAEIAGAADVREVKDAVEALRKEYDEQNRAFQIEEIAGGLQLLSRPEYRKWIALLGRSRAESRLTQAALETLAIIAWRQPVTRADVEAIRGVQSGELVRSLVERRLVKIVGRLDVIGRPMVYGTTRQFLHHFGLMSIKDLPQLTDMEIVPGTEGRPAEPKPEPAPAQPAASEPTAAGVAPAVASPETPAANAPSAPEQRSGGAEEQRSSDAETPQSAAVDTAKGDQPQETAKSEQRESDASPSEAGKLDDAAEENSGAEEEASTPAEPAATPGHEDNRPQSD
ncbi:MAG: SMC-Scp complex subunit ScpB, partial [Planctomycetes bacterium]|nr:SMC-Scp complex subunit ScpB [Planctomycetota bacterium]